MPELQDPSTAEWATSWTGFHRDPRQDTKRQVLASLAAGPANSITGGNGSRGGPEQFICTNGCLGHQPTGACMKSLVFASVVFICISSAAWSQGGGGTGGAGGAGAGAGSSGNSSSNSGSATNGVAGGPSSSPSSILPNRNSQTNAPMRGPMGSSSSNRPGDGAGTAPNGRPIGSPGSGPGSPEQPY
jgi:hypothetical protein